MTDFKTPIRELINSAPKLNAEMASELNHLIRRYTSMQSLFAYWLDDINNSLIILSGMDGAGHDGHYSMAKMQGSIQGRKGAVEGIIGAITANDPAEEENKPPAVDENDPFAPLPDVYHAQHNTSMRSTERRAERPETNGPRRKRPEKDPVPRKKKPAPKKRSRR